MYFKNDTKLVCGILNVINYHSGVVVKGLPIYHKGLWVQPPLMGVVDVFCCCDLKTANQLLRVPFSLRHKR